MKANSTSRWPVLDSEDSCVAPPWSPNHKTYVLVRHSTYSTGDANAAISRVRGRHDTSRKGHRHTDWATRMIFERGALLQIADEKNQRFRFVGPEDDAEDFQEWSFWVDKSDIEWEVV